MAKYGLTYEFSDDLVEKLNSMINKSYLEISYINPDGKSSREFGVMRGLYGNNVIRLEAEEKIKDFDNPVKRIQFVPLKGEDGAGIKYVLDGEAKLIFSSNDESNIKMVKNMKSPK